MLNSKEKAKAVVDAFYLSLPLNADDEINELLENLQVFIAKTSDEFWKA